MFRCLACLASAGSLAAGVFTLPLSMQTCLGCLFLPGHWPSQTPLFISNCSFSGAVNFIVCGLPFLCTTVFLLFRVGVTFLVLRVKAQAGRGKNACHPDTADYKAYQIHADN